MAEFCWECFNKISGISIPKCGYVLSWDKEICEECRQPKRIIIRTRFWVEAYLARQRKK